MSRVVRVWPEAMAWGVSGPAMPSVHLQYVGRIRAKRADLLQPGEDVVWNGGSTSTVATVEPVSAQFLLIGFADGHSRRMKRSRLVAHA